MHQHKYQTIIAPGALRAMIGQGNLRLIDCRFMLTDTDWGRKAYAISHLPGAVYAHLDEDLSGEIIAGETGRHPLPSAEAFALQLGKWGISPDDQVVCYDQGAGGIAARAWWMLKWLGHQSVAVLDGGWQLWQEMDLPVDDSVVRLASTVYPFEETAMPVADADEIASWTQSGEVKVCDARAHDRFLGENETIDPVAGHIPGAISLPFADNLQIDNRWKSPEALKRRFAKLLKSSSGMTAFYCGSGVTACHDVLAYAHAGLGDAILYPGSWSEWIVDSSRGVARGN